MSNPHNDIVYSMALLRSGVVGKSKEYEQASGLHYARLKVWQIRCINYTIIIGALSAIAITIYTAL